MDIIEKLQKYINLSTEERIIMTSGDDDLLFIRLTTLITEAELNAMNKMNKIYSRHKEMMALSDRIQRELTTLNAEICEAEKYFMNVMVDTEGEPDKTLVNLKEARKKLLADPEKYFKELDEEEKREL